IRHIFQNEPQFRTRRQKIEPTANERADVQHEQTSRDDQAHFLNLKFSAEHGTEGVFGGRRFRTCLHPQAGQYLQCDRKDTRVDADCVRVLEATKISSSESDSQRRSSGLCDCNSAMILSLLPLARISASRPFCLICNAPASASFAGISALKRTEIFLK